jgi:hypothetical protein
LSEIVQANELQQLKYAPKDSLQVMSPSHTSDILHNNLTIIEQLKPNQRIELVRYLIKEPLAIAGKAGQSPPSTTPSQWPALAARFTLDLPLLCLQNGKFIKFQAPNKCST